MGGVSRKFGTVFLNSSTKNGPISVLVVIDQILADFGCAQDFWDLL